MRVNKPRIQNKITSSYFLPAKATKSIEDFSIVENLNFDVEGKQLAINTQPNIKYL